MVKAVAVLKAQGLLATVPGRGTRAASPLPAGAAALPPIVESAAPASGLPHLRWQLVARTLRGEIAAGLRAPGTALPPAKTLAAQSRVDQRTMRKALQQLFREGYLGFAGGRYAVAEPPAAPPRSRIVLVMRALPGITRPFDEMSQRTLELFRELERHCLARRIRLDCVFGHYLGTTFHVSPSVAEAASGHASNLLGFILWTLALSSEQIALFVRQLEPYGLPVAVLDEIDGMGPLVPRLNTMRVVTMATGAACGRDMGRYLIRLGHRRVVYLDFEPLAGWSLARLEGLRQAYRQAGLGDAVACETVGPEEPPGFETAAYVPGRLVPAGLPRTDRQQAVRALQGIEGIIWRAIREEKRTPRLWARLEQVRRMAGVTAWVPCNDNLAVACLRFLRQQDVRVPGDLSVAGFDDEPPALYNGLTSYSFNPGAVARTLVDTVLKSPAALKREPGEDPVQIPGYISERHSVAAPPAP